MDRITAQAISRIGKELAAALESGHDSGIGIMGQHGKLGNYSSDYVLGLGVSLGILWECVHMKPVGAAHQLELRSLLQWVRDVQKIAEHENLVKKDVM